MASLHVLVIDDEPAVREILATVVSAAGYSVDEAGTIAEAGEKLSRGDVDVALCDVKLPDGSGIDLVRNTKTSGIGTAFIMITAFASVQTAVDAMRAGAFDYMAKPVNNEEVIFRLGRLEEMRGLSDENVILKRVVREITPQVYRCTSPAMLHMERLVSKVAPTNSTILITGESGTGKGVVARMIHEQSPRRNASFLAVNCSAIPEHLMESEFFGHLKGAFTSADRTRKGLLLEADKGTLFLDEIGELPLHMQTKLLNVIEDKMIRPVGSERAYQANTRIIAATNRNLSEMVREGRFRDDLFFRLTTFQIAIPPLRERPEDIRELVHFLLRSNRLGHKAFSTMEIDASAEEALLSYEWPGNVRELENVIYRACILAESDCITLEDLPEEMRQTAPRAGRTGTLNGDGSTLREQMRQLEVQILTQAIQQANGDRRLAAERLGVSLSTLYRKLEDAEASCTAADKLVEN